MTNKFVKRIASTALTLSGLSIKGFEAIIPTMISVQKDPSFCFQGLVAGVSIATISAPFAIKDENKWVDKSKFFGVIPWALLMTGVEIIGPSLYPAAWFLASFGSDYLLVLIDAYQNHSERDLGDFAEIGVEGIKRALLAALILTDGYPGSVLAAIKQNENITSNQFYLAASASAASLTSFTISSARAVCRFFRSEHNTSSANNTINIERNRSLEMI